MAVQTALDNIWLRPCQRWGHTEYSMNYHHRYMERVAGVPSSHPDFARRCSDGLQLDFHWSTNDGLVNWGEAGRVTDMGHAVYAADGSDRREPVVSPFAAAEEVWAFDAVAEYGLPDADEQVAAYERSIQAARTQFPNQLTTGGYYKTIVSGAIQTFGWEMLLVGAADAARMEPVFDSFYRRTLFHMEAWARTSVEVVIQHDDFVWTEGAFMHPEIYRRVIIPRYAELWKPIHRAGKKVLFCSDANFMEFVGDLAEAGADGFVFEPCVDFGTMATRFGQSHCLVGSFVDCRDLTFRDGEKVLADLERTFRALEKCRGALLAVGNHLPPNIPPDMLDSYYEYLLPRLQK
ncbi:MAG: uroporphyrinogen decarboxylase family protein [Gemmatimonadota bacterium]